MIDLTLQRTRPEGKAVRGTLLLPFSQHLRDPELPEEDRTVDTLENADFLIPAGTYPLEKTFSYKFKKFLPILNDVPERNGIRIHRGSLPEHSKGCILTSMDGMTAIDVFINRIQTFYENESITLTVRDPD